MASWGKIKIKNFGGKNEKEKRKKEENYTKKRGKGLKNASFWTINSKKSRGGLPTLPQKIYTTFDLSKRHVIKFYKLSISIFSKYKNNSPFYF